VNNRDGTGDRGEPCCRAACRSRPEAATASPSKPSVSRCKTVLVLSPTVYETSTPCGEGPRQPDAFVEWADGQQPGVAGQLTRRRLVTSGVPKKSRTCDQAEGILVDCPVDRGQELAHNR
jgi:hypothetical protein